MTRRGVFGQLLTAIEAEQHEPKGPRRILTALINLQALERYNAVDAIGENLGDKLVE